MNTLALQAAAKIDRRFAQRHPKRVVWLRPATPVERREIFRDIPEGWFPCMAVWREGATYRNLQFFATTPDVADASEGCAITVATKAAEALKDGAVAHVILTQAGRLV